MIKNLFSSDESVPSDSENDSRYKRSSNSSRYTDKEETVTKTTTTKTQTRKISKKVGFWLQIRILLVKIRMKYSDLVTDSWIAIIYFDYLMGFGDEVNFAAFSEYDAEIISVITRSSQLG